MARSVRLGQSGDSASSAVFVADDALVGPYGLLHGDAAERRGVGEPTRLLRETKRRVGDDIPLVAAGRSFRPDELYARSVAWTVRTVAEREGGQIASVTVTVPAAWGEHRRRTITEALTACGVTASLATEPAAAAAHYCATHDVPVGAVLAVYDFGGGTFDLAFVRHEENDDIVLHTDGIAELGGADFDDAVFAHVVSSLDAATPLGSDPVALAALRRECVSAKEALSFDPDATIPVLHCGASIRLIRAEFEAMIDDEIERTVALFARARADAGLDDEEIHAIVLSGGTSRIPRVAQQLSDAFDLPLKVDADPKAVVALGAARLGARAA
ncbi:MAG TPA: Hsp70 family protein, partial [Microbacterium sp.]|nr:Hsp70 family protein [Microbacterium sp.]